MPNGPEKYIFLDHFFSLYLGAFYSHEPTIIVLYELQTKKSVVLEIAMNDSRSRKLGGELAGSVFLILLFTAGATAQDNASDIAGRIRSLETSWNQAEQQQDTKALERLLGEKFIYIDVDGTMQNRAKFLDEVKNRAEHIDVIGVEPDTTQVYVYGDSAVASGIYREKGNLHGKPYYNRGRFTDTWVRQGTAWVCVASQSTLIAK